MKILSKITILSLTLNLLASFSVSAQLQGGDTVSPEGGQTLDDGSGGDPFQTSGGGNQTGGNNNNDTTDYTQSAAQASAILCGNGEIIQQGDSKAEYVNNACETRGGVVAYVSGEGNLQVAQNPNAVNIGALGASGSGGSAAGSADIDLTLSSLPTITDLPDYGDVALIYNPITLPDFDPGPIGTGGTGT
jgi:hypothetical protein